MSGREWIDAPVNRLNRSSAIVPGSLTDAADKSFVVMSLCFEERLIL